MTSSFKYTIDVPGKIKVTFNIDLDGTPVEVKNFKKNWMLGAKLSEKVIKEHPELL